MFWFTRINLTLVVTIHVTDIVINGEILALCSYSQFLLALEKACFYIPDILSHTTSWTLLLFLLPSVDLAQENW